jgi:hypothetical protein
MNLRMIGISAVVVGTVLLPLVAAAGPAPGPTPGLLSPPADPEPGGQLPADPEPGERRGSLPVPGAEASGAASGAAEDDVPRTAERCGPEVSSSGGIKAQTCVLSGGRETWARTYYRNATDGELRSVLSLMGPGGRTVQTHCVVETHDAPAACETRREPSRGGSGEYSAVAEFAGPADPGNGGDVGSLLLRAGSNSPASVGR